MKSRRPSVIRPERQTLPAPAAVPPVRSRSLLPRYAAALCLCVLAMFIVSLIIRLPWYGKPLLTSGIGWPTAGAVKYADYWYNEGPARLRFAMLENPPSVETPNWLSRNPYVSYPPGTIIPIYLVSLFAGHEADVRMVDGINLAGHLLIALCLALLVFVLLSDLRLTLPAAFIFSLIPALLLLLLPGPLGEYALSYFSDQAVSLPIALFLLLEILQWRACSTSAKLGLDAAQCLVIFSGALTDWYFFFVLAVALAVRCYRGMFGPWQQWVTALSGMLAYCAPALLALALFLTQLVHWHLVDRFLFAGLRRMALYAGDPFLQQTQDLPHIFWRGYMRIAFGAPAVASLWGVLAIMVLALLLALGLRWRRRAMDPRLDLLLCVALLTVLPPFLHTYCFRQHAVRHAFAALKYTTPMALAPLVLLPVGFLLVARWRTGREDWLARPALALSMLMCLLCGSYLAVVTPPGYRRLDAQVRAAVSPPLQDALLTFRRQYGYNDILFSYHFSIPENPPMLLAISHKRVYRIAEPSDIASYTHSLRQPYHVVVLDQP